MLDPRVQWGGDPMEAACQSFQNEGPLQSKRNIGVAPA